jgi:MraZ protein
MWENVGKMAKSFFSGSYSAKLDEKNRFVLPQELRYQLVEDGKLEFTIALSMGGCLAIYRKSDITEIVERFKKKQHIAKFQKFFTLFFSTLVETTCDKVGRIMIPSTLKNGVGMKQEVVIAGALNKIELWPKEVYDRDLAQFIGGEADGDMQKMMEEAFSLLSGDEESGNLEEVIGRVQNEVVKL